MEIWKDIVGYEGYYQISTLGRVKSLGRDVVNINGVAQPIKERILKTPITSNGYLHVALSKNGKKKTYGIHKLLAIVFLPNTKNQKVVNHIDGDKLNNDLSNLEFVSHRENTSHYFLNTTCASIYAGVYWEKTAKRWYSKIQVNKKNINLGHYKTEVEAHQAYQNALVKYNLVNKYS